MKLDKRGKLKVSEADVQKPIVALLRASGWVVRPAPRMGHHKRGGPAYEIPVGEPDLICVKWVAGVWDVLMIEVKASDGVLSLIFRIFLAPGVCFTVMSARIGRMLSTIS